MPLKPYGKRAGGCFCLWPMILYYQDKKKPVFFGPFFGLKSGFFCVQFDLAFLLNRAKVFLSFSRPIFRAWQLPYFPPATTKGQRLNIRCCG